MSAKKLNGRDGSGRQGASPHDEGMGSEHAARIAAAVALAVSGAFWAAYAFALHKIAGRLIEPGYAYALFYVAIPVFFFSLALLLSQGVLAYGEATGHLLGAVRTVADLVKSRFVVIAASVMLLSPLLRIWALGGVEGSTTDALLLMQRIGAVLLGAALASVLHARGAGAGDGAGA